MRLAQQTREVNGDGFEGRLAVFRMADEALDGFQWAGTRVSSAGCRGAIVTDAEPETFRAGGSDTIADMSGDPGLVFAHSGSTLQIAFQASGAGWQGDDSPTDEAWGIDNLQVELIGMVPEPSTAVLIAAGPVVLAIQRKRGRRA